MLSWCTGILCICLLLAGCGGGKVAVKPPPAPPSDIAQEEVTEDTADTLAEQLSDKRLEELYEKSGLQGEDPVLEAEIKKWDQTLKCDVPIPMNKQVKAYLVYFTTERKRTIRKYLSRSTRYMPMIREVFQEHGLPEDLAYLAMIESGFNPYAYSHAHACGMWQFIRGTGRRYGLAINNYVDERRDPEKSTRAAAKYLLDLYKQFGSWYLAAASYNCGENRVQRELNNSTHKNFWELSGNQCLPKETKNYVPQMIAATIIAKNPGKFGFKNVPHLPPMQYDTVKVDEPTSLTAVSVACNVPPEEIELLNPELRKGVTPPDTAKYTLKIPKHSKELFARNIQVARIEVPAQAKAPVRTYRRSRSHHKVAKRRTSKRGAYKSTSSRRKGKSKVRARNTRSKRSVRVASVHKKRTARMKTSGKRRSSVRTASILGGGKAASKSTLATKRSKSRASKASKSRATKKSKSRVIKRPKSRATKVSKSRKTRKTRAAKRKGSSKKGASKSKKSRNTRASKKGRQKVS